MNTRPTMRLNKSDDHSMHTDGARIGAVRRAQRLLITLFLAVAVTVPGGSALAGGAVPIDLGTAADFGALAGAAISGTGSVEGDVGSGTGAIAPAITSSGTVYPTGAPAVLTALNAFATAYNEGKNRPFDVLLSAGAHELGGTTLTPGVYRIGAAATLASPVTLNAQGNADAVFIIQIVGALGSTAAVGNVVLANNAQSRNIFWVVEGAVSIGAGTHMEGTILGGAGAGLGAGTTLSGRVMAGSAAGAIALATIISAPPPPPVPVGGRVWLDVSADGIQDPGESTGFASMPVDLLQIVDDGLPVELGAAAAFGALAGGAISGTGSVAGDVGSGTGAIAPGITSTGTIYPTGAPVVMTALNDFATAYSEAKNRPSTLLSAAAYELGGTTLTPGAYKIGAAATLATPVTLNAGGDPDAVFVIQIVGAFGTTAAIGNVILANAAQSRNVFWAVDGAVSLGAGSRMEGTILGGAAITFGAGATMNGRALAGTPAGTVALATTAITVIPGTPPVVQPPSNVVASTVTDANGNYVFNEVQPPGTFVIRWNLSGIATTDFVLTAANQGGDDALDSDGVTGAVGGFVYTAEMEIEGATTYLDVDLGLVATLPSIKKAAIDDLTSALLTYQMVSDYTAQYWTALNTAKTNGDVAINAAIDPAGVAAAKAAALAAMDAVPTFAE